MDTNDKVKVKLKAVHTHEGVDRKPGDVVEVYPDTANFLIEQGVAEKFVPAKPGRDRT